MNRVTDNLNYWVWFAKAFGTDNNRLWQILSYYDDVETAYEEIKSGKFLRLFNSEIKSANKTDMSEIIKIIEYCESKQYRIITYDNQEYPNRLKGIYNPPPILFCVGSLGHIDDEIALTVVGTRNPSDYSLKVAQSICTDLAKIGTVLISGFAIGIDSQAHSAALRSNTPTIAVLGCGLDIDYPKENKGFKNIIAKSGGAVITEFFPGTLPLRVNFPHRNRIMAGLSLGTLVIEAGSQSGSLITAELALQNGRDVFCIPPADIFDMRYDGCAKLIRDGAIPVFNYLDIVYEYYSNFTHKINISDKPYNFSHNDNSVHELKEFENKGVNSLETEYVSSNSSNLTDKKDINWDELNDIEISIIKILQNSKMPLDDISEKLNIGINDLMTLMTELEISGYVTSLPGNIYSI